MNSLCIYVIAINTLLAACVHSNVNKPREFELRVTTRLLTLDPIVDREKK